MDSVVTFLYDHEGEKTAVQLLYDEYLRLSDLEKESPLLRVRIRHIAELLQSGSNIVSASDETAAAKPAHEVTPEPIIKPVPVYKFEPEPEPEPVSKPTPAAIILKDEPTAPDIVLSESSPVESTAKEYAMPIPPMLLDFLTEQDPSQKAKRLIVSCAQKLSGLCKKRITLSLHKPYICLWDFDEWKTFAFGEIIQGCLYLSVESSLQPHADATNVWVPPSGLCKKPLVRRRVDAVTDELLAQLSNAINHLNKPI